MNLSNVWYNKAHLLIGKPHLAIIASNTLNVKSIETLWYWPEFAVVVVGESDPLLLGIRHVLPLRRSTTKTFRIISVQMWNIRCNIFSCTLFHHSTHSNANTCPFPVCPSGCAVHTKSCTMQPRDTHKWVFHLCTSPVCTENGGVSECYTGLNGLEMQHDIGVHFVQKRQNVIYLWTE